MAKPESNKIIPRLSQADDEKEAIEAVKNVLDFLSHVSESGINLHGIRSAENGLCIILETCVSTLSLAQGA